MNRTKKNETSPPLSKHPKVATRSNWSWRLVILSALLIFLLIVFGWSGGVAGVANLMAKSALAEKNPVVADWWLSLSKPISSSNPYSEFLRARSARQQGNLDLMASYLKSAYDHGYDPQGLQREQSLALANMGQFNDEVEQELNRWLQEPDVEIGEVVDSYANGLAALSRFDEAKKLLVAWERDSLRAPMPNYRLARIYEHFSQYELAEEEYRKATEKAPKFLKAKYSLARLQLHQRRPSEAIEFYRACESGPSALAAKAGMAQCYKAMGDIEKSRELLTSILMFDKAEFQKSYQAVDELPERFVAASELGCIETELGHFSEAKHYLELALESHPLDSIARYSYAVALRGLGMKKEAEENFERTRATRSALDQVTSLQEKIKKDSHDTAARIAIGKIILENESERTGVYWIQSVFSYDPENLDAHATLVDYYERNADGKSKNKQLIDYHRSFFTKNK